MARDVIVPFSGLWHAAGEEEKKKRKKKKKKDVAALQAPAEGVKELAMEAEPSEQKRKHSEAEGFDPEVTSTEKTPGRVSEKKRRRSQTAEGSDGDLPSKIRKTSESESGDKQKDGAQCSKYSQST